MKLGLQNKREVAVMVVLVIVAIWFAGRFLFSSAPVLTAAKSSTAALGPRPATTATAFRGQRRVSVLKDLRPSLDPSLKFDLLKSSEEKEYEGGKRNIFREQAEEPKIERPITPVVTPPPVDPGPPPPPPIPLKFYGFASRAGEARRVFLSSGDELFIAEEGQIIQRRYKILEITTTSVEVEDVLNNHKQTIPLTQG